ncbi:MAG: tetratricopeptide repeat protein [Planctomycetes bacterium]|nr:tetratricopeptide repeat protein [Planctomycetota bacterium]
MKQFWTRAGSLRARCAPLGVFLAIGFGLIAPATAGADTASDPPDSTGARLLAQADALFERDRKGGHVEAAIEAYQKVLALDDRCADAYWKLARAHFVLGDELSDTDEQAEVYREGIELAKLAVALDERSAPAHFWLGLLYGVFGRSRGMMQSLHLIEPIKAEMLRVIELDAAYENAGAYRVLGRMYWAVPRMLGGDSKVSVDYLRKAIGLAPADVDNRTMLAESCISEGLREEARTHLEWLFARAADPAWAREHKGDLKEARRLLARLEGGGRRD